MKKKYLDEIRKSLQQKLGYKNLLEAPRLEKIVINRGVGSAARDMKIIESSLQELAAITGQRPIITRAKKSLSNFKIRKNDPIGCKVTLRKNRMYDFFDKLINVALPRIKDFRGLSTKSFDKNGNYTIGLKEQIVFPEIEYDKVQVVNGMDITIQIKSKGVEESKELLKAFGMPFSKS